ncbi:hypothetical protein BCT35_01440 [Vibrio lentus]|uniref:hypothetical protein n=1 Tax=Vibrio lentus TaxID=136468 RepID=UPI000C825749|nr:hypothetical protein [Vibrio lentus]PMN33885.1 hypothetical protein BCT35_01440 [Vibrio lentus]
MKKHISLPLLASIILLFGCDGEYDDPGYEVQGDEEFIEYSLLYDNAMRSACSDCGVHIGYSEGVAYGVVAPSLMNVAAGRTGESANYAYLEHKYNSIELIPFNVSGDLEYQGTIRLDSSPLELVYEELKNKIICISFASTPTHIVVTGLYSGYWYGGDSNKRCKMVDDARNLLPTVGY